MFQTIEDRADYMLARILDAMRQRAVPVVFTDHSRRAKRRKLTVRYAKKECQGTAAYRDLLKLAGKTVGYASAAIRLAKRMPGLRELGSVPNCTVISIWPAK